MRARSRDFSEGADRRYRVGTFGILKADATLLVKLSGRRPGRAPNTLAPKKRAHVTLLRSELSAD